MSHVPGGFEWMKRHYGVPAKRGGRIEFDGKPGRITAVSDGHLVIHLDGEPARRRHYTHPCWRMAYLDADCSGCDCPKARCDGYGYGRKCCPDCKHVKTT